MAAFAFSTASIESARMAFAIWSWVTTDAICSPVSAPADRRALLAKARLDRRRGRPVNGSMPVQILARVALTARFT